MRYLVTHHNHGILTLIVLIHVNQSLVSVVLSRIKLYLVTFRGHSMKKTLLLVAISVLLISVLSVQADTVFLSTITDDNGASNFWRGYVFSFTEVAEITEVQVAVESTTGTVGVKFFSVSGGEPDVELADFGQQVPTGTTILTFTGSFTIAANTPYAVVIANNSTITASDDVPTGSFTFIDRIASANSGATWITGDANAPAMEISGNIPVSDTEAELSFFDVYPEFNDGRLLPNTASKLNAYLDDDGTLRAYYFVGDDDVSELVTTDTCLANTRSLLAENSLMQIWCLESNEYQIVDLAIDPLSMRRDNLIISSDGLDCRRTYFYLSSSEHEVYDTGCWR